MRACDKKSGQDKFEAFKILATASPSHLAYVYTELETISGYSVEKTIEHEYSGDMKTLLLVSFLKYNYVEFRNPIKYSNFNNHKHHNILFTFLSNETG
ncbi:unnamed protein product [Haemonchus placei]|uniref:Uncharacterized protein n=1 Tax=Haemonchus placei TaxID=6290 RepID=A0A0N4WUU7_HAEPC|nr:unnamed protein product [Haemonchus placei]